MVINNHNNCLLLDAIELLLVQEKEFIRIDCVCVFFLISMCVRALV
jgi:hypothetical protein